MMHDPRKRLTPYTSSVKSLAPQPRRHGGWLLALVVVASALLGWAQPAAAQLPGSVKTLQSGWNLVGGPTGTTVPGAAGSLYTWPSGSGNYTQIPATASLQGGIGYWAFLPVGTTMTLASAPAASVTVPVQAGEWVMIGNPGNAIATISDPSVIMYAYQPNSGYVQASTLDPGQGAWVQSFRSELLTITSGPPPLP